MSPDRRPAGKAELRTLARQISGADRTSASSAAIRKLVELPEFTRAQTIAFYSAIGDEVPVEEVAEAVRARGGRAAFPVRTHAGLEMALADCENSLRVGSSGIREPAPKAPRVLIRDFDVFVVPGLLFDRSCRRLGRGGGDYDRVLARARAGALAIGICYAERVVDELPEDSWDVAMNLVVTDRFVVRRTARGQGR